MKNLKTILALLALTIAILLAGQPIAKAGEGLDIWPITPGANGETYYGTLMITYKVVGLCDFTDTGVELTFHLRLYKNRENSWNFMEEYKELPVESGREGPYCLALDIDEGYQQQALLKFLDEVVRPQLKNGKYSAIFLKEVANVYETITTSEAPFYVIADVTVVAK